MITQSKEKIIAKDAETRPPVVVVLGHVDHGKSSLLEAIREDFRITAKEAGGITQHIGAYQINHDGKKITFLDTPGHEIFSAMRSRGAKVADIAILVVAADESVKPQTIEAIKQVQKADIPMVVAINKIDRPNSNVDRVKQELAQHEVIVESYGGQVPSVETSATTKQGMKELLDMLLLVAEIQDLEVSMNGPGKGVIIESTMDTKRGPTATLLVQEGEVKSGDFLGTKSAFAKIRLLEDFEGNSLKVADASMPARVLGFLDVPQVGEQFQVFKNESAWQATASTQEAVKNTAQVVTLDPEASVVNIVLKADVAGSLEALKEVLEGIPQEEVALRIVQEGVGEVGENDVKIAGPAKATIFGFRTKVSSAATDLAEKEGVGIQKFEIIYELIQAVRTLLDEEKEKQEEGRKEVGTLHVLGVFLTEKNRQVVGGKVVDGEVRKGVKAEVLRENEIVGTGNISNVQQGKKNVTSVEKGSECGLSFEGGTTIQAGDRLQFFTE